MPEPIDIPQPPTDRTELERLQPLELEWAADQPMVRCLDIHWGSRDFYAGDEKHRGRFHPFTPSGASEDLEVLYCADGDMGALSETVFHDVPVTGAKVVTYRKLIHRALVPLNSTRTLRLVDLTSDGLRRLGLSRPQLIESDPRSYPVTAAWGKALHDWGVVESGKEWAGTSYPSGATDPFDGLVWVSRQRDTALAMVLFGDRVKREELEVPAESYLEPLAVGRGLERVCELAARADITISGLPGDSE